MHTIYRLGLSLALLAGLVAFRSYTVTAQSSGNDNNIAVLDTCLPGDPGWDPTGGCTLKAHEGDVPFAEFGALLTSPLSSGLIGHPAWRNEPSHVTAGRGKRLRVTNQGGRGHTFTEVANFGGGFVAQLNIAMTQAPECNPATVVNLAPAQRQEITIDQPGLHKFQCCIHPWMRATVRVE